MVFVPLPSVDAPIAIQTLDDDVRAIRKAIKGATSRNQDVIVFCQSYSGIPSSQAVENLGKGGKDTVGKGGVVLLFYCTAFVLSLNVSLLDGLGGSDPPWTRIEVGSKTPFAKWGMKLTSYLKGDHLFPVGPEQLFYNDLSESQQSIWASCLRSFSRPMITQPLKYAGYKDIPCAYLFCSKDQAIPLEIQQGMVKGSGVDMYTETLDASHSPFLSQPKATADVMRRAAEEKI